MLHPQLRSVEFSADGRFILSIGFETIRLWIAETGEPLSPFISAASARWHVREPRLFVEPRAGYYKTPWVQAHNTPLVWDLTPSTERAESLGLLTEFIAARRVDRAGALVELDAQSLRQVWEAFKSASAAPQYRAR